VVQERHGVAQQNDTLSTPNGQSAKNTKEAQREESLAELIELLKQVDPDSPLAALNETTISDNNGGRILL
jgi:hypothetical protein